MNDTPPASNVPEYTVSEISGAVKRTLEGAFGRVRVRGEITELKIEEALKPSSLPSDVLAWLNPRQRLSYFFSVESANT